MASSFRPQCNELKKLYDDCFNKWYADEFLKGTGTAVNLCKEQFEKYKACLFSGAEGEKLKDIVDEARNKNPLKDSYNFK